MRLLTNKTIEEYDELINNIQEQLETLQESRKRLIKEQWTIIEIQFHKKDYRDDQRLTVTYKDLKKEFGITEIFFEKPSITQFEDLLRRYRNNYLYKEENDPFTKAIKFLFKRFIQSKPTK